MALLTKSVPLVTNGDGVAAATVRGSSVLRAIRIELGTLDTPDISITDEPDGTTILALTEAASSGLFFPAAAAHDAAGDPIAGSATPWVIGTRLQIAIAGGGAAKTGRVVLHYER